MRIRTYNELRRFDTFEDRFRYLSLRGQVGDPTFGYKRELNQRFYRSREWRNLRQDVILRDNGCDMGLPGYEIFDKIIIHHMNPMSIDEVVEGDDSLLDTRYLICVTHKTHNAIHFGDENQLPKQHVDRQPGDTKLWNRR
jgi:hypothetical protein